MRIDFREKHSENPNSGKTVSGNLKMTSSNEEDAKVLFGIDENVD
jgi:hypothetical protein